MLLLAGKRSAIAENRVSIGKVKSFFYLDRD
jgi:hypothetical protein